ncbi:hypothetical protein GCM10010449_62040 [Streptomyces rectiviolaceus]|uniref:Uncharacterized protein n=1 Tax=Streptomyces rectiviolaceus TaxID=332591 RepID=A0ABP6N0L8_9ACTN
MSTPAQSSAISIRVEASIVAVRRGMERQYGTCLSVHRWGQSVRGPQGPHVPEWDFSIASRKAA